MKVKFLIIFLFALVSTQAQIKNIADIISGDYNTMKSNNIKTIILKNNGHVENRIDILSKENLVTAIGKDTIKYKFNNYGNLISVKTDKEKYTFTYSSNEILTNIEEQNSIRITKTSTPYPKDLQNVSNTIIYEDGSSKKANYIYNKINPSLSFKEYINPNSIYRKYRNGGHSKISKKDNSILIDSLYFDKEDKQHRYYKFSKNNKDSVIIISDSVSIKIYDRDLLIKERVENKGNVIQEKFYTDGKLINTKKYTYLPYYTKDLLKISDVLWKIESIDNKKKHTTFPNKKYFNLKNGKLIVKNIYQTGNIVKDYATTVEEKEILNSFVYHVISPSILNDLEIRHFIKNATLLDNNSNYFINVSECKANNALCIQKFGAPFQLPLSQIENFLKKKIESNNYTVEIIFQNDKTNNVNLKDILNELNFKFYLVGVLE